VRPKNIVVIALIAGTLSACAVTEPPRRHETRVVLVAPPAPRVVVVPEARAGYVWAPGYWRWNGHEHVWIEGRWLPERRGYHWVPERWEQRRDGWHFEEGHWER
jgi:hypothetical protein